MNKHEEKLLKLVIEYYSRSGLPIWSKFLEWLEDVDLAPSTIRKYLNLLEKKWLLYQPYNSAWRLPTPKWVETYLSLLLSDEEYPNLMISKDRFSLREFIEKMWEKVDWVAFWFLEDEKDIHYLWITKLLKKVNNDIEKIIPLLEFIETKQLITYLNNKTVEKWKINYSFVTYQWINIVLMYISTQVNSSKAIIWTVSTLRVNYKENIKVLEDILKKWTI